MFAALSLAAVLAGAPAAAEPAAPPVRACADDARMDQAKKGSRPNLPKARKSKLAVLPKPDMELTVQRKINGCTTPVKVRTGVQGDGRFANPQIESDLVPADRQPLPDPDAPQDAAEE